MNYLSVCSGIEAATVAWHHMGWKPVGFSEIEKFPSQVLAHHYPQVTNFGDMTKYKEWKLDDSIGLLVGGTPCQSFSVAGLRKGLDDPRGNLALTYVGILDKFRPKWCVWENVPGVLSSGGGRDFGSFLGALGELGYGWAYRVLDAQNFGVAQRRRRVFVVGCLGGWESAAKVLFESESLSGDIKKGRTKKQETSKYAGRGIATISPTIGCELAKQVNNQMVKNAEAFYIPEPVTYCIQGGGTTSKSANGSGYKEEQSFTLNVIDVHGVACIGGQHPNAAIGEEVCPTLTNAMGAGGGHVPIIGSMAVRRLTEVECERLQGFPDNYTNIKENCPSGPRYKALGNSMAVPVMRWIGERINNYERL
ncbi:Dcm Site-specific DNA methylase [uncultured Caudovirales phage]|uniref:DNA (cytosine-5-)-methyltransferase n=1 Tax=uncultured Caudovirales phage TaxID=2100421 RepID=A0A6J7WJ23_9CAUD|nr:Dcm Site-specific DNA methylase [uncultured Caudovirales phage]